jgi:release factor glutamine methyltransferase
MPTLEAALKRATQRLRGLETAKLDARLLLQQATGLAHGELIAEPRHVLEDAALQRLDDMLARRLQGEPVSRILGQREFYGRLFHVTSAVLDPRPDTECLMDATLALLPDGGPRHILDLGTGSGIIAITVLAERAHATGIAVDLSTDALDIVGQNARHLGVEGRLSFQHGSWFEGVTGRFDAILSNPPYIESAIIESLDREVRNFDPHIALDGGTDGLACYRAIAAGAAAHLNPKGFVAVEIGADQHADVASIFAANGFALSSQHRDLGGHIRCLVFHPAETA